MGKTRVGIINVTGYAGMELARLLLGHPEIQLTCVTGRSAAGKKLRQFFPHLQDTDLTIEAELGDVEFAFSAMPHQESAKEIVPLVRRGMKVVDISADFRLKDPADYQRWYGFTHPAPDLLADAVFGLTELHRAAVARATLVANPGCYPTSAVLALAPAVKEGLVGPDIYVDSKSGVSGAGRTLSLGTHFCEVNEDVSAYALEGHRHLPEIFYELDALYPGRKHVVTFIPHLIPMTRGILSTCYATLTKSGLKTEDMRSVYREFYHGEPFVRVTDAPPHTKHTSGSNLCLVYPVVEQRTGRLIVISCIDNLVKGAAGQAVQNMNVTLGIPETTGLDAAALYP